MKVNVKYDLQLCESIWFKIQENVKGFTHKSIMIEPDLPILLFL